MSFRLLHACVGLLACCTAATTRAQDTAPVAQTGESFWTPLAAMPAEVENARPWVRHAGKLLELDFASIKALLRGAPLEFSGRERAVIALPNPRGEFSYFEIAESPVMHAELAEWILTHGAETRTFVGQGLDDPTSTVRLDFAPTGFHAQVLGASGDWAIDPYSFQDSAHYTSYAYKGLEQTEPWVCHNGPDNSPAEPENPFADRATGTTLRAYDMAVAATASYTTFHGGTVAGGQAAIVTTVNRVNQIYERDFCVRFILVANNQNLIYTNANPGPYTDGNLSTMLGENQTNINSVIGSANYDIGHVVSGMNTGGLAFRPAICSASNKARGGTGLGSPTGDYFSVKYFGHEVGHQCNANHSFNADDSAGSNVCLPNRASSAAYEPGSGSTIMSYQGLCGSANNLTNWDTMFNQGAYANVDSYINGTGNCGTNTATGNNLPSISPLTAFSIPVGTAFTATATASDPNGDALTFSWEQRNLGAAQPETGTGSEDNGASPLFRVFSPTADPSRTFPRTEDVLDGVLQIGEQYPAVSRTLTLRVLARDNRAGGGAVATADVNYTVVGTAGPFRISTLNTAGSVVNPGALTLTWDVANTNAAPINAANIRILFSTDGGLTWPTVLAASTPNDGSETITLPAVATSSGRIRIEPTNNVFFDVNDANFITGCPEVPGVQASDNTWCDRVSLSWSSVPGATGYRISRGTTANSADATLLNLNTSAPPYQDTTAVAGVQYWYWVRANTSACTTGGPAGTGDTGRRATATAITADPGQVNINAGQQAAFSVTATGAQLQYQWLRNGASLPADPRYSGAQSDTLTISAAQPSDQGAYACTVTGLCGSPQTSTTADLTVAGGSPCDPIDFNGDGLYPDTADIDDFLSVFSGGPCSTGTCADIDFNNDGLFPDTTDIDSLLSVFSGGPCL
ncbi:MAG: M12 family metallo-peptidase [Phycisphaerales bacterium]